MKSRQLTERTDILMENTRVNMAVVCLVLVLLLSITTAVSLGPVPIPFKSVWKIALSQFPVIGDYIISDWTQAQKHIVWDIRFPRVLLGTIVGAGLAVVGVAMQALVRNPLADPYILGVSSGASVGATLVIIFGAFKLFGQYALSAAAFSGALLSIILVFLLAQAGGRIAPVRLLLSGIALSAVLNAVTSFIVMSAPREEGIRNALFWMMGSLTGARWGYLTIPTLAVIVGIVFLLLQSRALNAMLMGEETAGTLGVNTDLFNKSLVITTALLTGVIVAVSGAIGFVGLMMPHIVRVIVGSNHYRVLPVSALAGAIFITWSDVLARLIIAPEELPIGIITAMCGGPFFIWLLRRNAYSFGGGQK
jgi:iron complex transport system permease protein